MSPERWQKLDKLFHAALECELGQREAFIADACAEDNELRQELESMLAHHEQAASFIESPAYALAAETIVDEDRAESLVGKALGSYQILSLLGAGGMGEVYLAVDRELRRKVALKFLPEDLTGDSRRVQRFRQEARAASALNHPNILTVFAIGEVEGKHFIATEFVYGETLRQLMKRGRLSLLEVLDFAIQIASALLAAHAAGIVHRDIKPENIMRRSDGYIKIVDFGVAKLTERTNLDSDVTTLVQTETGSAVGTVRYMSPEQVRALEVDARSDLWSFGVVLFEMLTASFPFGGETVGDLTVSILESEPESLSKHSRDVPGELERIVNKALAKKREERYQAADEVLRDLRELKSRLESGERVKTIRDKRRLAVILRVGAIALPLLVLAFLVATRLPALVGSRPSESPQAALPPAVAPERVLSYSLTVQKMRNGRPY